MVSPDYFPLTPCKDSLTLWLIIDLYMLLHVRIFMCLSGLQLSLFRGLNAKLPSAVLLDCETKHDLCLGKSCIPIAKMENFEKRENLLLISGTWLCSL